MSHPNVEQLRFARAEFQRGLADVSDSAARQRFGNLNCISWIIGHLAWQEQRYWLHRAQGIILVPELNEKLAYGKPACTPPVEEMWAAWRQVTQAADPWLDRLTTAGMQAPLIEGFSNVGTFLLRTMDHYWYHLGEGMAVRQMLGHTNLPDFVGDIDAQAPYRPENSAPGGEAISKAAFLDQVQAAYAKWDALLASVSPEQALEPALDGWSLKDVIAHLTWHEREMLGMLQRGDMDGSALWLQPTEQRNQAIYAQYRDARLEALQGEARQVRQALIRALEALDETALHDPHRFKGMQADWQPWDILAGNTYRHYSEHLLDAQAWLQTHHE